MIVVVVALVLQMFFVVVEVEADRTHRDTTTDAMMTDLPSFLEELATLGRNQQSWSLVEQAEDLDHLAIMTVAATAHVLRFLALGAVIGVVAQDHVHLYLALVVSIEVDGADHTRVAHEIMTVVITGAVVVPARTRHPLDLTLLRGIIVDAVTGHTPQPHRAVNTLLLLLHVGVILAATVPRVTGAHYLLLLSSTILEPIYLDLLAPIRSHPSHMLPPMAIHGMAGLDEGIREVLREQWIMNGADAHQTRLLSFVSVAMTTLVAVVEASHELSQFLLRQVSPSL